MASASPSASLASVSFLELLPEESSDLIMSRSDGSFGGSFRNGSVPEDAEGLAKVMLQPFTMQATVCYGSMAQYIAAYMLSRLLS